MAYLRPKQAAEFFGVSTATLRRLAYSGKLPSEATVYTPGGHLRYDPEVLAEWLKEQRHGQAHL